MGTGNGSTGVPVRFQGSTGREPCWSQHWLFQGRWQASYCVGKASEELVESAAGRRREKFYRKSAAEEGSSPDRIGPEAGSRSQNGFEVGQCGQSELGLKGLIGYFWAGWSSSEAGFGESRRQTQSTRAKSILLLPKNSTSACPFRAGPPSDSGKQGCQKMRTGWRKTDCLVKLVYPQSHILECDTGRGFCSGFSQEPLHL